MTVPIQKLWQRFLFWVVLFFLLLGHIFTGLFDHLGYAIKLAMQKFTLMPFVWLGDSPLIIQETLTFAVSLIVLYYAVRLGVALYRGEGSQDKKPTEESPPNGESGA